MKAVDPEKVSLEEMIKQATEFHGHLGPFLVLGIRMGLFALKELNSPGYEGIEALVKTGNTPSLSCLLDGVQISTGCTMGKGNIATEPLGLAEADFSTDEKKVTFKVKDEILNEIKSWRESYSSLEEIAWSISKRSDEELFERL
ncbi:MAG TPA: formylmethanofuran dehydrogenase [Methanotrichaceae archaeon]|nr:formylmethanofuran dehydrogenase [Methanotrichaceae archaeon]